MLGREGQFALLQLHLDALILIPEEVVDHIPFTDRTVEAPLSHQIDGELATEEVDPLQVGALLRPPADQKRIDEIGQPHAHLMGTGKETPELVEVLPQL